MFRISEKYSGVEQRKIIEISKDKNKRNKLRRQKNPITRELDNYFKYEPHKRVWYPNGLYLLKRPYYYAEPGLGHFYEKNNIEELMDLRKLKEEKGKKVKTNNFIDFTFLQENQFIITIEYCSNCKDHSIFTSHSAELYKNYALSLQKCILLRFPFISVLLKPIETDIQTKNWKLPKVENGKQWPKSYINTLFKDVRIGAFEVQLCYKVKNKGEKEAKEVVILLHSKLEDKKWPKIDDILDKIVNYMPKFMGRIILYQKENEEEEAPEQKEEDDGKKNEEEEKKQAEDNNIQQSAEPAQNQSKKNGKDGTFKNELIEGIKVNIYLQKNKLITDISEQSWETILNNKVPLKRRIRDRENVIKEKMEMYKSGIQNPSVIDNKNFNRSRPSSAYSHRQNISSMNKTTRPST